MWVAWMIIKKALHTDEENVEYFEVVFVFVNLVEGFCQPANSFNASVFLFRSFICSFIPVAHHHHHKKEYPQDT